MRNQLINLKRQCGVVLFISLVALVVMSIAAVALIRSVDTNTTIAGNLSFQQSALISADRGVESAVAWVGTQVVSNKASLNTHIPASGYFATYGSLGAGVDLEDRAQLKADSTWSTYSTAATGAGITAGKETDTNNTIDYIIERMCSAELAPAESAAGQKCLIGQPNGEDSTKGGKNYDSAGAIIDGKEASPIYRVTVRVSGSKNTRSYGQIYVF